MSRPTLHPLAWLSWLLAVLVALSATRNPLHLILVLLCIGAVSALQRPAEALLPTLDPLRLALVLTLVAASINGLAVRFGATVLLHIPQAIPLLGGPITLEALAFGALTGLILTGVILGFGVVQRALPTSALIGLIPRAFAPLAVVCAIAITFVPAMLHQAVQIRDAQRIRGHQLRRMRDWLPLFLPLLIGGLERALQLAESIAARGFAGTDQPRRPLLLRAALVAGLALLLVGWLLLIAWGLDPAGQALLVLGAGLLIGALWRAGRRVPRTHYRRLRWSGSDSLVLLGATALIAALVLPVPGIDRSVLAYYPYPRLRLPLFDPALGLATLGLLWPAFTHLRDRRKYP